MDKSAINLLQETTIKQGYIPIYNFLTKVDGNNVQFTCNVSCNQMNANGTGRSKKEAKHNAAKNMLLLIDTNNNKTSLPVNTNNKTSLPVDTNNKIPLPGDTLSNMIQSPTKVCETSLLCKEPTIDRNYVGLLQEFCQQRNIQTKNILYELISEEGQPHLKIFTIEVSLGSLRERAVASDKKTAKQKAAKKLLLHVNSNAVNLNTADTNTTDAVNLNQEKLENIIEQLGIGILNSSINEETVATAKLSEKAKSLYLDYKKYEKIDETNPLIIQNFHTLFEKNYSSKIPYSMKEKMRIIRDKYNYDLRDLRQIRYDIEKSLKVEIRQTTICSKVNQIVCLRLMSSPIITQFGMGETKITAESRAMYNLVAAILMFLNI